MRGCSDDWNSQLNLSAVLAVKRHVLLSQLSTKPSCVRGPSGRMDMCMGLV